MTKTVSLPLLNEETACLDLIRNWINKQPHLPQNIPDDDLLIYLHVCRYSTEKAKLFIDAHYTIRTGTEIFLNRNLSCFKFKDTFEVASLVEFQDKTPNGEKILFFRLIDPNPSRFDYIEITRYCFALFDVLVHVAKRQPGYRLLYDLDGISLAHLIKSTPYLSTIRKEMAFACDALPILLLGIHIINASSIAEPLMSFLKPMLNSEMLNLIRFYSPDEISKLYEIIPKKILPKEYGGEAPSYLEQLDKMKDILRENEDYVVFREKQSVDESKRINKSKHSNDIYGIQGSFKTICLD